MALISTASMVVSQGIAPKLNARFMLGTAWDRHFFSSLYLADIMYKIYDAYRRANIPIRSALQPVTNPCRTRTEIPTYSPDTNSLFFSFFNKCHT